MYYLVVNTKIREGQADVQVALRRHGGEVNRRCRGKRRRKILPRNLCWIRTGTQAHREVVGDAGSERVPDVEVRVPPVDVRTRNGDGRVEVVSKCVGRGNINRVGKCVRCQCLQTLRQTPLKLDLECLVVRCCRIAGYAVTGENLI